MNPISEWIRLHLLWLKVAGALAILAAIGYGLWSLYHAGYQAGANEIQIQWDKDKIARDEAKWQALQALNAKINQAQEQHDHDQVTIDTLADDARRLRIHLPTACDAAAAGADPDRAARLLSDRVDASFAELQDRAGRLFTRCDQLNIDAIRANSAR